MPPTRTSILRAASLLGAAALLAVPCAASAATTTANVTAGETVSAGSLSFTSGNLPASTLTFPGVTLNGSSAQTTSVSEPLDIDDATGSGAGWNLTATSTTFTASGGATLAAPVINSTPSVACDSGVTCTTATSNTGTGKVTYPYTIASGSTAPAATKMYSATASTGMAAQTVTPTWTLTVPAAASAGSYSSTWTLSLVSGP